MKKLNKKEKILELVIAIAFVFVAVVLRLLFHLPNFTPVTALALFGGVYFSRKIALLLPLLIMIISDFFIGYYQISLMLAVYISFILCVLLGFWLKNHKKWQNVFGFSVLASLLFFIITNFAVWALTSWYSKDIFGLIQCYALALPFLRNSLLGDLFYVSCFFGVYEFAKFWIKKKFRAIKTNPFFIK